MELISQSLRSSPRGMSSHTWPRLAAAMSSRPCEAHAEPAPSSRLGRMRTHEVLSSIPVFSFLPENLVSLHLLDAGIDSDPGLLSLSLGIFQDPNIQAVGHLALRSSQQICRIMGL